jgi:hypothetical protein
MALAGFQFLEITKSPFADPEPLKLVRCCLKRFGAEHVQKPRRVLIKTDIQNFRRVLLKGFRTWAHRCSKGFGRRALETLVRCWLKAR